MSGGGTWHPAPETERPAPALLWLSGEDDIEPPIVAFSEAGIGVLAADLAGDVPDRERMRAAAEALEELAARAGVDPDRIAVAGAGRGGTTAFLVACHSDRPAAAVDLFGPLLYERLDAERPTQPLELALNLGSPLLAVLDESDPATSPDHGGHVERVLSQFARDFDIVRTDRAAWIAAGASSGAAGSSGGAPETWTSVLDFLRRAFDDA